MPTTFCDADDVRFLLTEAGSLRRTDDDEDGDADGDDDDDYIERAIEVFAATMCSHLELRYRLSDLAGNAWCKWTNAYGAVYVLDTRAAGTASPQVKVEHDQRLEMLKEIKEFRAKVPEQDESFDFTPCVTNYESEMRANRTKVRVIPETSTGEQQPTGLKRRVSEEGYDGWW